MMDARFNIFKGKDGQWYFNLQAPNGEIIFSSKGEGYKRKAGAENGVRSVKENASRPDAFKLMSVGDLCYFHLKAYNNQIIGGSQMYLTHWGATVGMDALVEYAPNASIHYKDPE